jgi:asparagine synthase (glutamine-hydrolysing)
MIKNILTLRYDPTLEISSRRFSVKDFELRDSPDYLKIIERSLEQTIDNEITKSNQEHVSVALSGGIDSVLIISLLRKVFPDIKIDAISVKFADSVDETEIASNIAQKFNANHHIIHVENFLEELPKAISIIKMPFWDTHWFHVVKKSKKFSKILVSGDGGDELFGGYTFRYEKFLKKLIPEMNALEKTKLYLECHERDWVPDQQDVFGDKIEFSWDKIYSMLTPFFDNKLSPIVQLFLADINGKLLYNWIPLNTSFHNFFGIKAITPLLSKELIEFAPHLDNKLKYDHEKNIGKLPLRKILSKYIDSNQMAQKKQGFSVNTLNLWKSHGKKLCDYYLDDAKIVKDKWINGDWIKKYFKSLNENLDARYVNKFLGLLAFEVWYRIFVTKEMDGNSTLSI